MASKHGFGISLLERYVSLYNKINILKQRKHPKNIMKDYSNSKNNSNKVNESSLKCNGFVFLVKNYRSHAKLLALPNKLFYDGQLIAVHNNFNSERNNYGNDSDSDNESVLLPDITGWVGFDRHSSIQSTNNISYEFKSVLNSSLFFNSNSFENNNNGVFFYGLFGQHAREPDSPSYYNAMEASQVTILIESLLGATIIIMTQYYYYCYHLIIRIINSDFDY